MIKVKKALLSVTDKTGLEKLAKDLSEYGVELISTGGTARYLIDHGFKITPIEEVSGSPEAFGGRMKSISFNVMSGLLFRREDQNDIEAAQKLNIDPIDLVVCNLYAFEKKESEGLPFDELIEHIDIGGPTLIRAAAKNHRYVAVATKSEQYDAIGRSLKMNDGQIDRDLSLNLARDAFALTASYDSAISRRFNDGKSTILRYGENPTQKARVVFDDNNFGFGSISQLSGKEMSYNNYLDSDAALKTIIDLRNVSTRECATVLKHLNPCGAAIANSSVKALEMSWSGDPVSSFGGIVAFSGTCHKDCADFLKDKFVEIIIASDFTEEAQLALMKKKNLRLLKVDYSKLVLNAPVKRSILGGYLEQDPDLFNGERLEPVTRNKMEASDLLQFGIAVTKQLKSNAVALVSEIDGNYLLMGAGMGNPNRVFSIEQACLKARQNGFTDFSKMVMVSDGFFPFGDSIELAHQYGITQVVQPGGSIRDKEVIEACDRLGVAMMVTGIRHFNH